MVYDSEVRTSKNGNEYLNVQWKVVGPDEYENRRIFDTWMLEGKAAGFTLDRLGAVAPDLVEDLADEELDFDPQNLFGARAELRLSVEESDEYGDKNRVERTNPPNSSNGQPDAPEDEFAPPQ